MKRIVLFLSSLLMTFSASANQGEYLIKLAPEMKSALMMSLMSQTPQGTQVEDLGLDGWVRLDIPENKIQNFSVDRLRGAHGVLHVQPNYRIRIYDNPTLARLKTRANPMEEECPIPGWCDEAPPAGEDDCPIPGFCEPGGPGTPPPGGPDDCPIPGFCEPGGPGTPPPGGPDDCPIPGFCGPDDGGGNPFPPPGGGGGNPGGGSTADNPAIPDQIIGGSGEDPLFNRQWGMLDIGVKAGWTSAGFLVEHPVVVGVIDTGADYTHEDLRDSLWRNPGETGSDAQGRNKATNGVDDDGNGYVDDVIGWDFVSNDNKPYDLQGDIMNGGNPGHGTHCAGNVGASANNGRGIAGVAPNARIMVLRFIGEAGQGTTADAIKAIRYAVDNGAQVTSNSWGSEGEDPSEAGENQALRDAIKYQMQKGGLFIAAAGNGHQGVGYDNDRDSKPAFPASYDIDNIISVAAIDSTDKLGSFSNWGVRSTDIAAPGVKVFSTVVGSGYTDMVLPAFGASWDGTSMATPHVAGAAALYWGKNPGKTWQEVKSAILNSAQKVSSLQGRIATGGKLDVEALMK